MKKLSDIREKLQKGKDDPCWKDYVQVGTKKKNGKEVPNCVPKEGVGEEKDTHKTQDGRTAKKGLWYNINRKRKRGESPAKKGDPDYPKTLDIDENRYSPLQMAKAKKEKEEKRKKGGGGDSYSQRLTKKQYGGMMGGLKKEEVKLGETITPKHVKMAVGVASDKRYAGGNMTGAVNAIEKIKKGLSDHPQVKAVLRKQNESLDEAGSPERLAMIKRAAQRVKDKKKAARGAEKKASFKAAARDMQTKGAQRGMAPLKRDIDEGRGDARKALMGLAKQGGIDKATFQKAYDLYSDTKFVELKKLISGADTDPREAILDVINRHDRKTFNNMYPRGLSKGGLTKESVELGEGFFDKLKSAPHVAKAGVASNKGDLEAVKGHVSNAVPDHITGDDREKLIKKHYANLSKATKNTNMKTILKKMSESVELGEAKISVGDRVTLQPNKNTLDRSLIGKAGVVTGMVGSKPTVKFANGQTIVVSPKDLKINESSELDEAKNYEYKDGKVHISKANFRKVSRDYKNPTKGKERMVVLDPKTQGTVSAPVVFTEESVELDEATYKTYMVTIVKGTFGGVKSDGRPTLVKAKSVRDATTRAAKKVKIDPRLVPTGGFDVKINSKESVEHENCGTPDCCGTCDTDIKEMNFFQFRNRLDRTRD